MRKVFLSALLVFALASVVSAEPVPSKVITIEPEVHEIGFWENVPFAEGVARGSLRYTLYMDVFQPKVKEKCPPPQKKLSTSFPPVLPALSS